MGGAAGLVGRTFGGRRRRVLARSCRDSGTSSSRSDNVGTVVRGRRRRSLSAVERCLDTSVTLPRTPVTRSIELPFIGAVPSVNSRGVSFTEREPHERTTPHRSNVRHPVSLRALVSRSLSTEMPMDPRLVSPTRRRSSSLPDQPRPHRNDRTGSKVRVGGGATTATALLDERLAASCLAHNWRARAPNRLRVRRETDDSCARDEQQR